MVSIQGQFTILEALALNHGKHIFVRFNSWYRIARSLSNDTKCKYQDICSFFIKIPEILMNADYSIDALWAKRSHELTS